MVSIRFDSLSARLICRRADALHCDRVIERLTRQQRLETLLPALRLIILIEQKDELVPKQVLHDHRSFGRKLAVGLTMDTQLNRRVAKIDSHQFVLAGE